MIAGMVLTNLIYVLGAIVVATVVSGFVLFRHRRPKSLEAGIEMFSRELKALQPEGPGAAVRGTRTVPSGRGLGGAGTGAVRTARMGSASAEVRAERDAAGASSPNVENESG